MAQNYYAYAINPIVNHILNLFLLGESCIYINKYVDSGYLDQCTIWGSLKIY